jgi:radical SAM superfamily enzyme YgiQ (UPF0313 family)
MNVQCLLFCGNDTLPGILRNAGPARLATELRDAGFETICVDIGGLQSKHINTIEKIINKFVGKDTLWMGISTTFLTQVFGVKIPRIGEHITVSDPVDDSLLQHVIDLCKKRNPSIKFIIGGGYFFNLSKYGFYHFKGYADYELVEFTKWCKESSYKLNINRIGRVIECNEYSNFVNSNIKWHETDFIEPNETLPIEISRGCIFRCKFCAFPLNGKSKGEWIKNFDILKNEFIYNYEKFGVTNYIFADDTYNDSADKILNLYEHVFSKLPFKMNFSSYIRLDLMYRFKDTAEILQLSGLKSALLGIETNNNESGKAIGKGLNFEKQIEYLHNLNQREFNDTLTTSGFILGLPKDTKDSIQNLENFLLSDNNPLDDWIVKPLGLNPVKNSQHKKYFSEFDLEHEKYGYDIVGSDESADLYRMKWKLRNSDIDYDYCNIVATRINDVSNTTRSNFKYGAQEYARMCTIIPRDDVINLGRYQVREKYDIPFLVRSYLINYYEKLLSY